jgi:general secretion pathway protein E
MDEEVRALVVAHRPAGELRRAVLGKGMMSLREDGLRQVRAGATTLDEVLRVTEVGG